MPGDGACGAADCRLHIIRHAHHMVLLLLRPAHRRRHGSRPSLELKPFPEARLEVLRAAEATHAPAYHDADALAKGLALLHAAYRARRKQ